MDLNFHEDLKKHEAIRGSSERSFGFVFAAMFAIAGVWPLRAGGEVRPPMLGAATVLLAVALVRPGWLRVLNRGWMQLGLAMGRVVNPIITGVLFFGVFAPVGVILRMRGKDPLRLRFDAKAESYWIRRTAEVAPSGTMARQF